jgi:flavin-dependent dehydrogenase
MPTTRTPRYDVIVVGARAAGAATAMLLARAGLDVLVVDRSRAGADTLSTHALMRGGVLQLHRWNLLDQIVDAGTPPVRRTTFTYADDVVPITIKPAHGVDALYAPRRTILDPILAGAADAAGAQLRHGTRITGITRDDAGRVDGVEGFDELGDPVRCAARWVIGADGVASVIARSVGATVQRRGTGATAVVYGYWSDLDVAGYEWIFRPDACAGAIPTNDGQACVFAAASPARIGRGGIDVLRDVVAAASPELAGRLADAVDPAGVRNFGGRPGHLLRPWGPGWALVGDAGHWKDPISAHGLTDALRDAELLALAVIDAASGRSERAAFTDYQRTRDRLSVPLFDVVDTIAGMRWTDSEIPELLLRLNAAMADEVETLSGLPQQTSPLAIGGRR